MKILLLDFETTGIDTNIARITEVGAMIVQDNWDKIAEDNFLVKGVDYPVLTSDIQRLTGITQEKLDAEGIAPGLMASRLGEFSKGVDFVIAYNRSFDEALFRVEMARGGFGNILGVKHLLNVPWLCAMVDIESNYMYKSWKQMHLALEYGITVNPKELHRAINDVELMRQILVHSGATPKAMFDFQSIPWVFVQALIPAPWTDGGVGKNAATKAGFAWETAKGTDGPKFEKAWVKRIKKNKIEEETKSVPFKLRELKT